MRVEDASGRLALPLLLFAPRSPFMKEHAYERLSALDESFLAFETPTTYMHVAMLCIFEPGSLVRERGGLDMKRIQAHLASRLGAVPRYRQHLLSVGLMNQPVWIDDRHFQIEYHVRQASLPRPGTRRQLERLCARILERPLDRQRPLWEMWMIEGLPGGRFAMLAKVHHCMVDGVAGVGLLTALLGDTPVADPARVTRWSPRKPPTPAVIARAEIARRVNEAAGLARTIGRALQAPRSSASSVAGRTASLLRFMSLGTENVATTPLNAPIGPHRRVDWFAFDLTRVKAVKQRLGGTINDVVLATVAGALHEFFARRGAAVPGAFRTLVPVDVRAADERGRLGNRVSVWMLPLPVGERDPLRRLEAIRSATAEVKRGGDAASADMLTQAADLTGPAVVRLAANLLSRTRLYNLIVTNVPGPQFPLYLLDARLEAAYPHVPLFHDQGLGIALFSYDGTLHWGLTADWDLVPDLQGLGESFARSFDALCGAARIDRDGQSELVRGAQRSGSHGRARRARLSRATAPI
jgi:diacylglycerol O-acyltransferase